MCSLDGQYANGREYGVLKKWCFDENLTLELQVSSGVGEPFPGLSGRRVENVDGLTG